MRWEERKNIERELIHIYIYDTMAVCIYFGQETHTTHNKTIKKVIDSA